MNRDDSGDFLDILAREASETVKSGYYKTEERRDYAHRSVKEAITRCPHYAVISEIKFSSPSRGPLRVASDVEEIARAMERGGAVALSVLTEPKHFRGSLNYLSKAKVAVNVPVLMKDFIVSTVQLDAAASVGADAVLLIESLFERNYCELSADKMIRYAHALGLEVLLESYTADEFEKAVHSEADMLGINNRDLRSFSIDFKAAKRILSEGVSKGRIVIVESGIESVDDIIGFAKLGAHAFLVGSSIMAADDIEKRVRELTELKHF